MKPLTSGCPRDGQSEGCQAGIISIGKGKMASNEKRGDLYCMEGKGSLQLGRQGTGTGYPGW